MSISAPPGRPSIGETLSSSLRDAYGLTKKNLIPCAILIVAGSIAAYMLAPQLAAFSKITTTGTTSAPPAMPVAFNIAVLVLDVFFFIAWYFAFAAAVRTIHPEYRMTVGQFFAIIAYSLLCGLLTLLAGLLLIIPAYWVGIKLTLAPYAYALGAPEPIKTAWNMTTGYYWQTFGMLLAVGFCVGIALDGAVFACTAGVAEMPPSIYVMAPLAFALMAWGIHVQALAYVRWANALLPRANMPQGEAVPAPA